MTNQRYTRQTVLPEIGEDGQNALSRASVLCVGAGGLGSPALLYLAAAGVGHIAVIDFDSVERSNLQRQTLFTENDIGQSKAEAAADHLCALNPDIKITPYKERLSKENAESLFQSYDVIIDGSDNFDTKFLVNDAALKTGKPWVYASVLGFDGQLAVFNDRAEAPCYRCLFAEKPREAVPDCAQAGVIGALVGIIGSAQALEAIKLILCHPDLPPLSGKLWQINGKTMQPRIFCLPKDDSCPACSIAPEEITLPQTQDETQDIVCETVRDISVSEAESLSGALWVDVREQDEWDSGYIEGALHAPLSALLQGECPSLPKNQDIVFYCRSGQRSKTAGQIFFSKGHRKIFNLSGGILAWQSR